MSLAVSFKASAACSLYSQLRHRIDEQDSGDITEYHVFSSMSTLSPTPIPKAPPEAPSPTITTIIGTCKRVISKILDRKSTRLNSSHVKISYAVFCLKKKNKKRTDST